MYSERVPALERRLQPDMPSNWPTATDMESFEIFRSQLRDGETSALMEIDQYEVCGCLDVRYDRPPR